MVSAVEQSKQARLGAGVLGREHAIAISGRRVDQATLECSSSNRVENLKFSILPFSTPSPTPSPPDYYGSAA